MQKQPMQERFLNFCKTSLVNLLRDLMPKILASNTSLGASSMLVLRICMSSMPNFLKEARDASLMFSRRITLVTVLIDLILRKKIGAAQIKAGKTQRNPKLVTS